MGIPFYFKNLVRTHSDIIKPLGQFKGCDRLFLDFNSIIHNSANAVVQKNPLAPYERLERLVINEVLEQVVKLINIVRPRKLLYIGIDGSCPRAKMTQQRKRRFISAWRNEKLQSFRKAHNLSNTQWDSNIITPGTDFMKALDQELKEFVVKNDKKLGFSIDLSPSSAPGEGEHKIMQYIKANDSMDDVIYGLDADLIMLSMISPNANKIMLLREKPEFNVSTTIKYNDSHLLLDIKKLRENMLITYDLPRDWDIDEFCNEYVMLCSLLGNDFIPPISYLKIKDNGIDLLINAYKKIKETLNESLVTNDGVNYMFLLMLLKDLSKTEDQHMKECCDLYYQKRYKPPHANKQSIDLLISEIDCYPTLNKFKHVIDPSQNGWRIHYYWHLFFTRNSSEVVEICNNYIQGIVWIYNYYFKNNSYYSWYYKYCYSPTLLDLVNVLSSCKIDELEASVASDPDREILMNNEIQLLMVLPPQSMSIIAPHLQSVMRDVSLGALHYYPWKFTITTFLKTYLWECSAYIPDIKINTLIKAYEKVTGASS